MSDQTRKIVIVLIKAILFSIAILIILDTLGISITPLLASLGVGSLAGGLALQDTLSNFFSGIYIHIDKPIKVGDFIKLDDGSLGHVTHVGWRSTHIILPTNNTLVLPNSKISNTAITNYDLPDKESAFTVEVGVSYNCNLDTVEKVTLEVAKDILQNQLGGVKNFEPLIRFHTFADSSINLTVILRATHFTDQFPLKSEFIKKLHARYNKEGIEIPFPQRVVHAIETNIQNS
jgi:small-conductance mechanosensitive channel